jgi:uncharacterized protein (DUF1330 family)
MSCYFIAQLTIHDRALYAKYEAGFDEIFARYEGKVVAVDDNPVALEGSPSCTRVVVIRFPSEAELRRWYDSPEYQALAALRWRAADGEVLLVHGRT